MITVIVKTKVNDMNYDKYTQLMGHLVAASQAEASNISYEHYENANIPNAFAIIEQWSCEEGFENHKKSDHFQVYWQEIVQLCLDEPEIIVFDNQETLTEN
ncbi:antibiotic biosynthesis monooxygenase [Staphylococcus simulans]|uniref:putative quinol monooxygenase n=1 Tax=Staphylococcus simulans TaxID=1286 RepID=UPI001F362064|nr:putative quinol monooxygenase [Staphylococcus simulans]MCE5149449.1 antibiotic biosynthesis monooxygenase [Staphylococcus simulans]